MKAPSHLDLKNQINRAKWAWRWHMQKGSSGWSARPYPDLRNEDDLRRYRLIEFKRRHTPFGGRVVSMHAWKWEQKRQRRFRDMVAAS